MHTFSLWRGTQVLHPQVHEYSARYAVPSTHPSSSDPVWIRPWAHIQPAVIQCEPGHEHRHKQQWSSVNKAMSTHPSRSDPVWPRPWAHIQAAVIQCEPGHIDHRTMVYVGRLSPMSLAGDVGQVATWKCSYLHLFHEGWWYHPTVKIFLKNRITHMSLTLTKSLAKDSIFLPIVILTWFVINLINKF